jgi:tyrosyl-tRNA synthetase
LNIVGFAKSNGEARRLIRGGGAKLNDNAITNEDAMISLADFQGGKLKMSAGKKRHVLIILS